MGDIPNYLRDYEDLYEQNPRSAALKWFTDAKYGLFLHYGLYSLLGRHEWVQFREKIPVAEYAKLKDQFTAENFDPDYIADFAVDCGMRYVNLTSRHHDSFCLFDTELTGFNSVNSPAKRDLAGELAEACQKRGLGFFLYYSHGRGTGSTLTLPTTTDGAVTRALCMTHQNPLMLRVRITISRFTWTS
jgi:alpha-L-fucosidase